MERKSSYSTAYKYKGTISEEDKKSQRVKRRSVEQRDSRQTLVNKRRNLEELSPVQEGASVLSDKSYKDKTPIKPKDGKPKIGQAEKRLEQLKKWKAEREEQKKKELVKQKPAFKVRKMYHQDVGLYKKESTAKAVMKPIDKPVPVKKIQTKAEPDPPKVKRLNKPVVTKSYEKPTIGFMARQGGEPKQSSSRQTRSQKKDVPNKVVKPQQPTVNHPTKGARSTRQTHGKDAIQTTCKDTVPQVSTASDLNLTKVSTSRGERESTYSFAPDEFTFNAASFVFNPLSPNSAQSFLNPGQETFVSFLDHNPKISSTPNNQKRKGRSSLRKSETKDSTLRESTKSDKTMVSTEKPEEIAEIKTADNVEVADCKVKDDMINDTVTSEPVQKSEQKEVERTNDTLKHETPLRRSSRRSVLSKVVQEEKSDNDNDVEKKLSTPVQTASRRSRRSVPGTSVSDNSSMVTKSGRKTRRSLSTTIKDGDVSIDKPTRRSTRKSVIISTDCDVIPETVPEADEEDSVFVDENVDAEKENTDEQDSKVVNVKTAALFSKDISNDDADKKETPGRRGAKTRNKSFAGFRLPDAHSVPLSASAKRKRRKTVMPKSPEEWVELLSKSPMIEMTRRTPKLNSSLPTIDFSDVDLSSPHLSKDTKEKERALSDPTDTISDLSVMPSDPKLNLFQALAESESLSSDKKEDNQKKDDSDKQDNKAVPMETNYKDSVEAMDVDGQEISKFQAPDSSSQAHDVKYFRALLTSETNRLKELCKQWEEINSTNSLSEEVSGQIRTTVGQAVLLMDQRFKQFSGLVDNCEFNTGEKETTCTDLDGFWDMIYFQVEDVDNKFEKLKKLRDNNWVDNEPKPAVKKVKKKVTKPAVSKPAVKSKFAAFRAKMKKNPEVTQSPNVKATQSTDVLVMEPPKYVIPAPEEEKVVKMGVFFRVASPVKSPRPHCEGGTPKKSASQSQVKHDEEKQETSNQLTDKPIDKTTTDKPAASLSASSSGELLMRRTPHRKSYAPVIPSPLLVDSTPQPRPVRSCTKKTPLSRQLLNYEIDINMDTSTNKENDETSVPKQSGDLSAKKRRRSARKSVNFNEAVVSPKPDSTTNVTIADMSTDVVDPANVSEEKFVDDDMFAKYLQPMSVLHGNSETENSPRSPKRRRLSTGLKACPSSNKRKSSVNKKVHFNSTACEDISGATMRRTPLPERRVTRRSLSQSTENENFFDFGLVQNSPQTASTCSSRPSLLYTPPDLPNRPVRPLREVPTATLISFTP